MSSTSLPFDDLGRFLAEEPFVRSLAHSLLFDEHAADEVVQQTWLEALRRTREGRQEPASVRGWLASVVRSRAANAVRARRRQQRRDREAAAVEAVPSAAELLEREELRRRVVAAVTALPETQRVVLLLRHYEDEPPRRIAQRLGVPVATVKTRLKRATAALRERLDEASGGSRRQWQLAMVPLALPPRAGLGALAAKLGTAAGWLLSVKWVLAAGAVAVAALLFALPPSLFRGEPAGSVDVAAGAEPAPEGATPLSEAAAVPALPGRASVEVGGAVANDPRAPSVRAAMGGFRGRVLLPTGAPAAGQRVRIWWMDAVDSLASIGDPLGDPTELGPGGATATADVDGQFEIHDVPPSQQYAMYAGVGGDHPTLRSVDVGPGPGEIVDLGTVQLEAKGRVTGRVVDADGAPVSGAVVWAADVPAVLSSLAPIERLRPDGAVFIAVPEDADPLDAATQARAFQAMLQRNVVTAPEGADYVVLTPPAALRRAVAELPTARTRTDGDGRFTLGGVQPGLNTVIVSVADGAGLQRPGVAVRGNATRELGELQLAATEPVVIQIVGADGRPVPGAEYCWAVRPVQGLTGILFGGPQQRADAAGRARLAGVLRRDSAVVAYRANAAMAWTVSEPLDPGDRATLELPALIDVELTVRAPDATVALDELVISLWHRAPLGEFNLSGAHGDLPLADRLTAQTTSQMARRLRLRGVLPGVYTVAVAAPGAAPAWRVFEAPSPRPLEFDLRRATPLDVRVIDDLGQPVHGAEIVIRGGVAQPWAHRLLEGVGRLTSPGRLARRAGTTDADGRLRIDALPGGGCEIVARHPRFGEAVAQAPEVPAPLAMVLQTPAHLSGTIFDHGVPVAAGAVDVVAVPRDDARRVPRRARVGAEGRFAFHALPPGTYDVEVEPRAAHRAQAGAVLRDGTAAPMPETSASDAATSLGALLKASRRGGPLELLDLRRRETVTLAPGQEREWSLDLDPDALPLGTAPAIVHGGLTVDGVPRSGCVVMGQRSGDWAAAPKQVAITDGAGRFAAEIRPQRLRVWLEDRVRRWTVALPEVELRAAAGHAIELDLHSGPVRLDVVDSKGAPAAGHRVTLAQAADGREIVVTGTTDAAGVLLCRAPTGTCTVRVQGSRGAARREALVVRAGTVAATARLQLSGAGMITGKIAPDATAVVKYVSIEAVGGGRSQLKYVGESAAFSFAVEPGEYRLRMMGRDRQLYEAVPPRVRVGEKGALGLVLRIGAAVRRR
ncbi:MAG: sigma-70 family RNA polymerase sigma factor [Planctomycetota bacterium]